MIGVKNKNLSIVNAPAVLPVHLAAVVVQLPVRAAGQPGDLEALGVAVLRRLAVSTVDADDAVTKKQMLIVRFTKMLKLIASLVYIN